MLAAVIGPAPVVTPVVVAGAACGVLLMAASLVLIRAGRKGRRPTPTRLACGVSGLIVGYHVLAWSLPAGMLAFRAPLSHWWVVVLGASIAVAGSLAADRLDGRVTRV